MGEFIEHVPKKIAMFILSECYRVLEKKGVIIILTPSRYNPKANKEPQHINFFIHLIFAGVLNRGNQSILQQTGQ